MRQASSGLGQSKCESCLSKVQVGIQGFSSSAVSMIVTYEKTVHFRGTFLNAPRSNVIQDFGDPYQP